MILSIPLHKACYHFFFKIGSLLNSSNKTNPYVTNFSGISLQIKLLDPEKRLIYLFSPGLAYLSKCHLWIVVQTEQNVLIDVRKSRIANDHCRWDFEENIGGSAWRKWHFSKTWGNNVCAKVYVCFPFGNVPLDIEMMPFLQESRKKWQFTKWYQNT